MTRRDFVPTIDVACAVIEDVRSNPTQLLQGLSQVQKEVVLEQLQKEVTVEFNERLTSTAGRANRACMTIDLSPHFAWTEDEFVDSVKHEYAHLLVRDLDGYTSNGNRRRHGPIWRRVHRNIGGNGKRCHTLPTTKARRQQGQVHIRCEEWCFVRCAAQSFATKCTQGRYQCGHCGGRIVRTNRSAFGKVRKKGRHRE